MLLVITPSQFSTAVLPLKTHKEQTGIPTTVITLDEVYRDCPGRDEAEKVKRCIAKFQQQQGTRFVLLVGDSDTFPVRYTKTDRGDTAAFNTAFYPTDLYYAALYKSDGSFDDWDWNRNGYYGELHGETNTGPINIDRVNLVPVVAVGRILASSLGEVDRYVQKVIRYEFQAYQASWAKNTLLMATHDWLSDRCQVQERMAQTNLRAYNNTLLSSAGSPCSSAGSLTPTAITEAFNRGVGLVSYMGHGAPEALAIPGGWWGVGEVPQLTNRDRLPIMAVAGCNTAEFATLPPYRRYVDIAGVQHPGTEQGERFTSVPPQPACLQRLNDPDQDIATLLTVGTDAGVVAYLGGVTGMQYSEPVEYFLQAIPNSVCIGEAWQWMVQQFYEVFGLPGTLSSPDWGKVAQMHQPWKYMFFGDPSLRIKGVPQGVPQGFDWQHLASGELASNPAVGVAADGRLEVFAILKNNQRVWRLAQRSPSGRFSSAWEEISSGLASNHKFIDHPTAIRWARGELQVYALEQTKRGIFHVRQESPNGRYGNWEGYFQGGGLIGGAQVGASVALNFEGKPLAVTRIINGGKAQILARFGSEGGQSSNNAWQVGPGNSGNIRFAGLPVIISNQDQRLEVFARDESGDVWHIWEASLGNWNQAWQKLGNAQVGGDLAVIRNPDGRLEVFARDQFGGIRYNFQTTPNGAWSEWRTIAGGGSIKAGSRLGIAQNRQCGLHVFGRWQDNSIKYIRRLGQSSQDAWTEWVNLGGVVQSDPVAAVNADDSVIVFATGTDFNLYQGKPICAAEIDMRSQLAGSWVVNGNGWWGVLQVISFDDARNTFTGSIYGTPITGSWNPNTRQLSFTRTLAPNYLQQWSVLIRRNSLDILDGTFREEGSGASAPSTQSFSWKARRSWDVAIKADNGQYWNNQGQGSDRTLIVNQNQNLNTQPVCFALQAVGDRIVLQGYNNLYVWAENAGGGRVAIAASAIGPWEKYQLVGLGGNRAAFKTGNNVNFLTVEGGGGGAIVANRTGIGAWETFLIEECLSPLL